MRHSLSLVTVIALSLLFGCVFAKTHMLKKVERPASPTTAETKAWDQKKVEATAAAKLKTEWCFRS